MKTLLLVFASVVVLVGATPARWWTEYSFRNDPTCTNASAIVQNCTLVGGWVHHSLSGDLSLLMGRLSRLWLPQFALAVATQISTLSTYERMWIVLSVPIVLLTFFCVCFSLRLLLSRRGVSSNARPSHCFRRAVRRASLSDVGTSQHKSIAGTNNEVTECSYACTVDPNICSTNQNCYNDTSYGDGCVEYGVWGVGRIVGVGWWACGWRRVP